MPRPKCAVIGVGNMGKNHVRTYAQLPEVELVAVSDISDVLRTQVGTEFNLPTYASYQEMIEKECPELVSICVPTAHHFAVAAYCLRAGVHVLVEKPITLNVVEAQQLAEIAQEKNRLLCVGHIERFNPAVRKVKELIDKGELGKITALIARRVGGFPPQIKDANIAVDLAIHDIDVVNYLLGELPQEIMVHKEKNHIEQREDAVEFFLKYHSASAYIQANWITPVKIRKLTITGSNGYLEMDYVTQQIEFYKSNFEKFKEQIGDFSDYILRFSDPDKIVISVAKKEPLKEELSFFIGLVIEGGSFDPSYAIEALKIASY